MAKDSTTEARDYVVLVAEPLMAMGVSSEGDDPPVIPPTKWVEVGTFHATTAKGAIQKAAEERMEGALTETSFSSELYRAFPARNDSQLAVSVEVKRSVTFTSPLVTA